MTTTETNPIGKIQKLLGHINRIEKMGGRGSFFGLLEIFEIIMEEEHSKDNETGMYRYKGMEQYGNIVSITRIYDTVKRCVEELQFTKDEFDCLIDWYKGRMYGPDTQITALVIGWCIKDKHYFDSNEQIQ
ncbi:MAG: hypothetical protein WCI48_16230 [Bacteroidota bacterium]